MMSKYIKSFFGVILMFIFNSTLHSQESGVDSTINKDTESIYFKSSALFRCAIRLPKNYNSQEKNTLIIGLHGGGSSIENLITIWDNLDNIEFIYAVPQAPYPWLFDKELRYDWALWPTGNSKLIKRASNLIGDYIIDLTMFLKKRYNISDVYLLGFSQGAIFTYIAGIKHHNLFKGLIIHSGPGLLEPLASRFTDEPEGNWLEEKFIKKQRI